MLIKPYLVDRRAHNLDGQITDDLLYSTKKKQWKNILAHELMYQ